jgi:hypothetical protein
MYCVVPKTDAGIFLWEDSSPASTTHAGLFPMLAMKWEIRKSKEKVGCHPSRSSTGHEASDRPIGPLQDALARAEEALLGRLPVDDVPDVLDIGSLAIEILLW